MRLVLISDTHGLHHQLTVPDGDILIHAGDQTLIGELDDLIRFNAWLGELPHPHKIVIAGNHDWCWEESPEVCAQFLTNAIYLQDSAVTIGNVRLYGSPWTPEFNAWAFNLPRGAKLRLRWAQIPRTTDVLITHGPPRGILDRVGRDHTGCDDLADAMRLLQPPLHVFGHIHEGYGVARHGRTTLINASSLDAQGHATNPPIVVDLHDGVVTVLPIPLRGEQQAFAW